MIASILMADQWFAQSMLSIRTPFFVRGFEVVTFFGSVAVIVAFSALVGLFLLRRRERALLTGFLTALVGAALTGYALKELVGRVRPGGLMPAIAETGFSFPSGHAVASMAFYGFIAFVLSRYYPEHKRTVLVLAAVIIFLIGFSRLYLGVHFLSDVLAGYVVGGFWLILGIRSTRRLAYSKN